MAKEFSLITDAPPRTDVFHARERGGPQPNFRPPGVASEEIEAGGDRSMGSEQPRRVFVPRPFVADLVDGGERALAEAHVEESDFEAEAESIGEEGLAADGPSQPEVDGLHLARQDRKSTRLNSS